MKDHKDIERRYLDIQETLGRLVEIKLGRKDLGDPQFETMDRATKQEIPGGSGV